MIGSALLVLVCLNEAAVDRPVAPQAVAPVRFAVLIGEGQVLYGSVDQGESDIAIGIADDERHLALLDTRERGVEVVAFDPPKPGRYWIEIRGPGAARVALTGAQVSAVQRSADVLQQIEAAALQTEAKRLFAAGNPADLRKVAELLAEARGRWRASGQRHMEMAAASGIGDAHYMLSEFAAARAAYGDALALGRLLSDVRTQAEVLNNLAMVSWPLGDVQQALQWLSEAESNWRRLSHVSGEAIAINNRGILLWEAGDYGEARRAYRQALEMFERIGDTRGLAYALNNMGVLLEALGEYQQALTYLGRAITRFHQVGDTVAEGRAQIRLARVHLTNRNAASAQRAVTRALIVLSSGRDRLAEADASAQQARIFQATGRTARARYEFHQSLARYRALNSPRGASEVLHDLGRSHLSGGDAANAFAYLGEALAIRTSLGLKPLEADTLFYLARADQATGNLAGARARLERAIGLVETLRGGVLEKQLRASYGDSKRQYYAALVDVLIAAHFKEPAAGYDRLAFDAAERTRARGLSELLQESWTSVSSEVPADLRTREQSLRKSINYWSWQLWQRSPSAEIDARLQQLLADHEAAIADIRRVDPRFARLIAPERPTLADIQNDLLDAGTSLVVFHLGDHQSVAWVVTPRAVHLRRLPAGARIESAAQSLIAAASSRPARGATAASAAAELRAAIIDPIADLIGTGRLVLAPEGALHAVPWATVLDRELVITPAASVLTMLKRETAGRQRPSGVIAAIGDPVFEQADPRVTGSGGRVARTRGEFMRLPHSLDEVTRILSMAPASRRMSALGFDASRQTAMSPALAEYRLIHFATHAVQDTDRPALSGIVLSMVDREGRKQDGFLRLQDIYNLRLRADLVVLSACETGVGRAWSGEGVASLARGLFHAGAASVVSTLWKVDDEATAALMEAFYRRLLSDAPVRPAEALRAAQKEMQRHSRWSHPYYWAGFILQGVW